MSVVWHDEQKESTHTFKREYNFKTLRRARTAIDFIVTAFIYVAVLLAAGYGMDTVFQHVIK